jgi:hypothetical protein
MAKKSNISPFLLLGISTLLLSAGWLMAPFPVFIFLGLAPLFALVDRTGTKSPLLEKMEYVLLALSISLVAYAALNGESIVMALIAAIVFTLAFVAHAWVWQTLGIRTGKITLILFWLGLEYVFLKLLPNSGIYIADTLRLQGDWTRWNVHTGYLGSSFWVLAVNWCFYQTFLHDKVIHWGWLAASFIIWLGPAAYSYTLTIPPISRQDMINFYKEMPTRMDVTYLARGEFIVRTAAWLSTLILLFTLVKSQTTKR